MWIRTVSGWRLFEVKFTKQGIPYSGKEILGNINLVQDGAEKIKQKENN